MVQTDNSQSHWFSLSKYILWFFYNFYEEIVKESFNTSHVTLYQSAGRPGIPRCRVSIHHMLLFIVIAYAADGITKLFQYITCYSLSAAGKTQAKMFPGFNTSHVTLYRKSVFVKTQEEYCFNTSHVTLYQTRPGGCYAETYVSIHHMLLFIRCTALIVGELYRFQYITCYSLSIELADKVLPKNRFNTSHVTLYRDFISEYINPILVSIHHMLLFIEAVPSRANLIYKFQYITCYSLSNYPPGRCTAAF